MTKYSKEFKDYVKAVSKKPSTSTFHAIYKKMLESDIRHNYWESDRIENLYEKWKKECDCRMSPCF